MNPDCDCQTIAVLPSCYYQCDEAGVFTEEARGRILECLRIPVCEEHREEAKWTIKMIERLIRATEAMVDVGFFQKWGPPDLREPLAAHGTELRHLRSLVEVLHNITKLCRKLQVKQVVDKDSDRTLQAAIVAATDHRALCEATHFMLGGWNPLSSFDGL